MKKNIKNIDINYKIYGKGPDVVLLHGWGQNIEMMEPLGNNLIKDHRVIIIDLPGFGQSSEPLEELSIYDYADIVKELLDELDVKNPSLIGHSFGGRIAIIYASKYKTNKVVLLGAPCIRKEKKESAKVKFLKTVKKLPGMSHFEEFAKKHIGSPDYRAASPMMRQILVNTVNEDLTACALKIKCPTLLIWGTNDTEAPIEEAKELEKLLEDGGMVVYEGGSHYTYLEFLEPVSRVIKSFL